MLAIKNNKKIKILFYLFLFIFLSTVSFFEKTNIFNNKFFFNIDTINIYNYKSGSSNIDNLELKKKLGNLILGKNLLLMKPNDIEQILNKNSLISDYKIQKKYPSTINIELNEINFVGKMIKNKKKYLLTNNSKLLPSEDYLVEKDLPNIYGKDSEIYFNDLQKLLKLNNFNLNLISSYYFFQINRWDLVLYDDKTIKLPSSGLEEAIKMMNKILNSEDFSKYSIIDLRINNKIITQ